MPTKPKHVHKLRRFKYKNGNILYFCTLPDCNFKSAPGLTLGKRSICNICDEEFIMNEYSIRLAKPHCEKCHKPKEKNHPFVQDTNNLVLPIPHQHLSHPSDTGHPPSLADRLKAVISSHQEEEEI